MKVPFFDLKRQYASIRPQIEAALHTVMESCGYIGGTTVERFEQEISGYLKVGHAVGCGNGTDAIVLALRACGVRPGDEVITTPFSFFATAEAVASVGAVPVFADICLDDFNLDAAKIGDKISPKTCAILPVHLFGAPCDMDAILALAHNNGLRVIEDAAQAIGCEYKGKKIGSTADISCFSFYPTKNLGGIGDGGLATTHDDDLALILRSLREHGAGKRGAEARALLDETAIERVSLEETDGGYDPYKYWNSLIGYNSRLDAIQAAALSVKLHHLEQFNNARAEIATYYNENLCAQVIKPVARPEGKHCWHQYVIRTEHKKSLCTYLNAHGVGVGTFYPIPLHLQKAFDSLGYREGDLPNAEKAARETVCLPIFPELTPEEMDYVVRQVNGFFAS